MGSVCTRNFDIGGGADRLVEGADRREGVAGRGEVWLRVALVFFLFTSCAKEAISGC